MPLQPPMRWRTNCHFRYSSVQLTGGLRPRTRDLMVLLHKSICTYHSAIWATGKVAGQPISRQGGQPISRQTLLPYTKGSLFESKNHLSQHNIELEPSPTVLIGYIHHFTENIDLEFVSNISLYDDNHDYEIGPALAGPAESAHNMTL